MIWRFQQMRKQSYREYYKCYKYEMAQYGMKINIGKMKVMKINDEEDLRVEILKRQKVLVDRYRYLGSMLTKEWTVSKKLGVKYAG